MLETLTAGSELFFRPDAVLLTALGCLLGIVIGVLPGLGPLMGIILLIPFAFKLPPVAAMGMLIAVYVGGSCGGAISAILLRIPGTPLAAATLLDGYPMAKAGRQREAIGLAVVSSALGGLIGGIALIAVAPLLASMALRFGPPEYFALTLTGLLSIAVVSHEATLKGLMTGLLGLLVATIGMDPFSSHMRFTFGSDALFGGIHIVSIVVGLFALSEMFAQASGGGLATRPQLGRVSASLGAIRTVLRHWINLVRSGGVGVFFGALPGAGGVISAFTSYAIARSLSSEPEKFGKGAEDGVIATEAANNACCGGTLIPTLALSVPGDASAAVLMGALILLGFFPGPELFENSPDLVGGIFLAYMAANLALLVLGLTLAPLFASALKVRKQALIPIILLLSVIGTYALQGSVFDLWIMLVFGVIGYVLRRYNYPLAPIVIGAVLGPICENAFRRSLIVSGSDYSIFVERPISAVILAIDAVIILWLFLPAAAKRSLAGALRIGKLGIAERPDQS